MTETQLEAEILDLINNAKPDSVEQLINLIKQINSVDKDKVLRTVNRLEEQGKIRLIPPSIKIPENIIEFFFTQNAVWFWIILIVSIATSIAVFTFDKAPMIYLRQALGFTYILFLPGYSLVSVLFPEKKIKGFEKTTLSIGLSLALTPLLGMLLNYTTWGLRTWSVTISLLLLTIALSFIGIIREYNYLRNI